ncbi:RadC family protein [Neptunicella marina]|uniref:DNA repair protein RadC n=1 Tax=Neptunicella marina TaxID=2125989 RepID=A0A8J6LZ60_9ALTE|nr:DNA repair protein RadC [Neptunicella marina]
MKITDWPAAERPREKLLQQGAERLSDAELVAIFLRTGITGLSAVDLARQLLNQFGSLRQMLNASQQQFCSVKGLGQAKYVQLQACIEMTRRFLAESLPERKPLQSASDTRNYLIGELRDEPNEVFAMILLDNQHRVIRFQPVFFGTIDAAAVYPRVLVKLALETNAAAVILAHNHPSGIAEPSEADKRITRRVIDAMNLVDIRVLDHFVVGDNQAVSFAERGLL